jgi:glycosyltransferase involved in cell wall biosynthesis
MTYFREVAKAFMRGSVAQVELFERFFAPFIEPLLSISGARSIVEIGSGNGSVTRHLLRYCRERGGTIHAIDLCPPADLHEWEKAYGGIFTFHRGRSLDLLPTIERYDAVLIDGDHNWYTVYHELRLLKEHAKGKSVFPLTFLHDVSWPYGRRDVYVDPETIPGLYRHPYAQEGMFPDSSRLQSSGGLNAHLQNARTEGGAQNGVLTAIEDFLREADDIQFLMIPGLHGLGILIPKELSAKPRMRSVLRGVKPSGALIAHIDSLERERIAQYLERQEAARVHETLKGAFAAAENSMKLERKRFERERKASEKAMEGMNEALMWERKRVQERDTELTTIFQSRVWRWSAPIRHFVPWLRRIISRTSAPPSPPSPPIKPPTPGSVAVIIPCHNYGRYLAEAIESALAQTAAPAEVVVVDDDSDDETPAVAARFGPKGVRSVRCSERDVTRTRNIGAAHTSSPFLIFLDADDRLAPDYIEQCLAAMADPTVAVAYGNFQHIGESLRFEETPPFDRARLERQNYISSHALLRRQVFDIVGGYRETKNAHEDWDLYKRMLRLPWRAEKVPTFVEYRGRKDGLLQRYLAKRPPYWHAADLLSAPVTIFTPFAGRTEVFPTYLDAVRNLRHDPSLIHLHWYNTSPNPDFGKLLRLSLQTLPFGRTTYTSAPIPPSWNHTPESIIQNRLSNEGNSQYFLEIALVRAYNTLLATCDTPFTLTIEDDNIPEPEALRKMLQTFEADVVAVVAPYPCLIRGYQMVWRRNGEGRNVHFLQRRTGVEEVDGSGFGCSLFRTDALRKIHIYTRVHEKPRVWYDYVSFSHLREQGRVLCNWDVDVQHLQTNRPTTATSTVPACA